MLPQCFIRVGNLPTLPKPTPRTIMPKLNPILTPLALLLSLCLLTACVTTPLHRFAIEVRNLGNEEIRDIQVRCGRANCITKPAGGLSVVVMGSCPRTS
jgi:hypothetical protein